VAQLGIPFFDTGREPGRIRFIRRAAEFIRREKIQIVHGHHGQDIWPTILAARLAGTHPKIVLTRHLAKSPGSFASRNFLLAQCDAVIAVSEFVARVLREGVYEPRSSERERRARPPLRGNHAKIRVIPAAIDVGRFCPLHAVAKRRELGLAPGDYAFALVGGFNFPRGKGQREFLTAAAQIQRQIPRARFLIIGQGNMHDLLKKDISRLGLDGKAWLTGQVGDMPQVMNAIDCLVHPPLGTEALGLVVCEAQACGKPVIASAIDGIPEAFNGSGYGELVAPEDVEALGAAMVAQATAPELDAAQNADMHRRVAEKFSLEQMGLRTLALYRDLLK
jgi:glycosyltransferase involved in cell wall biosynthesis